MVKNIRNPFVEGELIGFVGCDESKEEDWRVEEIGVEEAGVDEIGVEIDECEIEEVGSIGSTKIRIKSIPRFPDLSKTII
jgi:hypothetical protein